MGTNARIGRKTRQNLLVFNRAEFMLCAENAIASVGRGESL